MKKLYTQKNRNLLFPALLALVMVFGVKDGVGQEVVLSEELRDGSLPIGWSVSLVNFETLAGGYARFTDSESTLTSSTIDLSEHENVYLTFDVAKYGSGVDGPITVEISDDGGVTWTAQTFDSPTPTGSTYLTSGPTKITATGDQIVIRWVRTKSPSEKRLRDVTLLGEKPKKWSGEANNNLWNESTNWLPEGVPNSNDIVVLDNSIVHEGYDIILPDGDIKTEISALRISPQSLNEISLILPGQNTSNPGLSITGPGDALIINEGGVLINSSGASAGSGFELTGTGSTIRINNGGRYVHNTTRAHAGAIVAKLSDEVGTEEGIFEFRVPGTGTYSPSTSGRTYGTLILSSGTTDERLYTIIGASILTVRGDLIIEDNAKLQSSMSGEILIKNDLIIKETGAVVFTCDELQSVWPKVTVEGAIINEAGIAGLVIEHGGSLIHNTDGVPATIELEIAGASGWGPGHAATDWYFVSSPVTNQSIGGTWTPGGSGYDFYAWNEADVAAPWLNQKNPDNSLLFESFNEGRGYLVAYEAGGTKLFSGNMNTVTYTPGLSYNSGSGGFGKWAYEAGYNLMGNPYPSGYHWKGADYPVLASNFAAIYIASLSDYIYVEDGVIHPTEGFFVRADAQGDLTYNPANRVHHDPAAAPAARNQQGVTKNSAADALVLVFGNDERRDNTTLRLMESASLESDRRDAFKFFSLAANMPQVFTQSSDGQRLAVNSIPEAEEELVVPVGLRIPETGTYFISLDDASGQFAGMDIYLYDRETETEALLSDVQTYHFEATATGDDLGVPRFEIRFKSIGDATNVYDPEAVMARIYAYDNTLVVRFGDTAATSVVELYDLSGRLLMQQSTDNASEFRRVLDLQPGVYVVRVSDNNKTQTERVFIQ